MLGTEDKRKMEIISVHLNQAGNSARDIITPEILPGVWQEGQESLQLLSISVNSRSRTITGEYRGRRCRLQSDSPHQD